MPRIHSSPPGPAAPSHGPPGGPSPGRRWQRGDTARSASLPSFMGDAGIRGRWPGSRTGATSGLAQGRRRLVIADDHFALAAHCSAFRRHSQPKARSARPRPAPRPARCEGRGRKRAGQGLASRSSVLLLGEDVAGAAHGEDALAGSSGRPRSRRGCATRARRWSGRRPPARARARASMIWSRDEHAAGALGQRHQQVELVAGELARLAVDASPRARRGRSPAAEAQRAWPPRGAPSPRAAQDGADARQQLARLERLGQVVVGAQLQADDAVHRRRRAR